MYQKYPKKQAEITAAHHLPQERYPRLRIIHLLGHSRPPATRQLYLNFGVDQDVPIPIGDAAKSSSAIDLIVHSSIIDRRPPPKACTMARVCYDHDLPPLFLVDFPRIQVQAATIRNINQLKYLKPCRNLSSVRGSISVINIPFLTTVTHAKLVEFAFSEGLVPNQALFSMRILLASMLLTFIVVAWKIRRMYR